MNTTVTDTTVEEKVDNATVALMKTMLINEYANIQRLKTADDIDKELARQERVLEAYLKIYEIDFSSLK